MRTVCAIGIGLAIVAGVIRPALAQVGAGINFAELFQQLDANGDQIIDKGEVPESGRAAFDRLLKNADANHDGKIDLPEYRDALRSLREAGMAPGAGGVGSLRARLATMDKDGDGKISRAEFLGQPVMFERLDADKDGFVTKDESAKVLAALEGTPDQRFKLMDKDGDDKLTRDEFLGPPFRFDVIDTNKDGVLTVEELRAAQPGQPAAGKAENAAK